MALRFHWRLPNGGEQEQVTRSTVNTRAEAGLPDLAAQTRFCRAAEECGIDALLTDFGPHKPDSILLTAALGMATKKIGFIVAYRSGLIAPASFVQQLNTLSSLIDGRFALNIVAGHSPEEQRSYGDFLPHDDRYARTEEFLAICNAFWNRNGPVNFKGKFYAIENSSLSTPFVSSSNKRAPEIFIAGSSKAAKDLAVKQGTCWMQFGDSPKKLAPEIKPVRRQGIDIGLRMSIIARRTRQEAIEVARELVGVQADATALDTEMRFVQHSDSVSMKARYELSETEWLSPCLWTGAIRSHGASSIALVGSWEEVANALLEYGSIGVSQFILAGWPKLDTMLYFGREILPIIRERERGMAD